mgnify:FL=1
MDVAAELLVTRKDFGEKYTIGVMQYNSEHLCYTLEDRDRGLKQTDSLLLIKAKKVFGVTAIPAGRYEVIINYSNRFKRQMPLLLNVPGFEGVRIHTGNYPEDTEGCILVGMSHAPGKIIESKVAYNLLMEKLLADTKRGKIFITIQ